MSTGLSKPLLQSLHSDMPDSQSKAAVLSQQTLTKCYNPTILYSALSWVTLTTKGSSQHQDQGEDSLGRHSFCFKDITLYLACEGQDRVSFQRSCGRSRPVWLWFRILAAIKALLTASLQTTQGRPWAYGACTATDSQNPSPSACKPILPAMLWHLALLSAAAAPRCWALSPSCPRAGQGQGAAPAETAHPPGTLMGARLLWEE